MLSLKVKHLVSALGAIAFVICMYLVIVYVQSRNTITTYGNVDVRAVTLGFRVFGRIKTLNYEEGDKVSAGDVLAILEKDQFEEEVNVCQAELAQAVAALHNAELLYDRRQKLLKDDFVSQGEFDDASSARDEAQARLEAAKSKLEKAKTNLGDTEIKAPNSGIILTRIREPGSIVDVGGAVYTLALNNPVWIRTYIDEPNLGNIYQGQKATVITDSGDSYEGQIGFISPQAEFTPKNVETTQLRTSLVYRLRVIIDNPNNGLRQGMPVTVKIAKDSKNASSDSSN